MEEMGPKRGLDGRGGRICDEREGKRGKKREEKEERGWRRSNQTNLAQFHFRGLKIIKKG
jgi:hypothetical protein